MINHMYTLFYRWPILAVLTVCLCCSCTAIHLPTMVEPSVQFQKGAERLFINGDFENALLEFEQIYETALAPEDRNLALYGLACTQIILARSDSEFIEGIHNLQKWDATKGHAPFIENRHLLILALKQQAHLIEEKHKETAKREQRKNRLIANQKAKITQMASTVEKLQNQLKELEAIDENFQEKRKPL